MHKTSRQEGIEELKRAIATKGGIEYKVGIKT